MKDFTKPFTVNGGILIPKMAGNRILSLMDLHILFTLVNKYKFGEAIFKKFNSKNIITELNINRYRFWEIVKKLNIMDLVWTFRQPNSSEFYLALDEDFINFVINTYQLEVVYKKIAELKIKDKTDSKLYLEHKELFELYEINNFENKDFDMVDYLILKSKNTSSKIAFVIHQALTVGVSNLFLDDKTTPKNGIKFDKNDAILDTFSPLFTGVQWCKNSPPNSATGGKIAPLSGVSGGKLPPPCHIYIKYYIKNNYYVCNKENQKNKITFFILENLLKNYQNIHNNILEHYFEN